MIFIYIDIDLFHISRFLTFLSLSALLQTKKKNPILAHALADGAASALTPG